jgi:hypothetical protein
VKIPHISKDKKTFKSQASAGKVMLPLFGDCNGPIMDHYLEQVTIVTAALHTESLKSKLKLVIRNMQRGLLSKGVLLLHNNVRLHCTAVTIEAFRQLKFELLPHPSYNPDLGPLDYHMFGPLKEDLCG